MTKTALILITAALTGAAADKPRILPAGAKVYISSGSPRRTWVADKFCLVSLAEALSRAVPDTDCRVIL